MAEWKPLEIVALVAVLSVTVVCLAWFWAWWSLRSAQLENEAAKARGIDERATRLMGQSLGKQSAWPTAPFASRRPHGGYINLAPEASRACRPASVSRAPCNCTRSRWHRSGQ